MKKLALLLALAALPFALACGAPAGAPETEAGGGETTGSAVPEGTPRLVLVIVVDQMRGDYLERFAPLLKRGLARLLREGIVFTDTHHFHSNTETAPGHATLATGALPKRHGIVSNTWFDRERGQDVYCCGDPDHGVSPRNMLAPALGDLLKAAYPQAKVYAASAKDRAAILMGGHDADGAWWYGRSTGSFVTSTYYGEILRAGILSIEPTQWEAARSTGLGTVATLRHVILPQGVRNVLPDLAGNTLEAVKLTSLASVVALPDLLRMARVAQGVHFNPSPLILAALLYLALLWPLVRLIRRLGGRAVLPA